MTRTGPEMTLPGGGNVARAKFCNRKHAALVIRIHADGSTSSSTHGLSTLFPAGTSAGRTTSSPRAAGSPAECRPPCSQRPARRTAASCAAPT